MHTERLDNVVVVGAGAAGVAAAETIRREGYQGSLVLLGDEAALPYDRPPLSKQVLVGTWDADRTVLRTEDHYTELDVRLHHGRASGLDLDRRLVQLADGAALAFGALVIATGVRPRQLPEWQRLTEVHVLRGHPDVVGLRSRPAARSSSSAAASSAWKSRPPHGALASTSRWSNRLPSR